MRFAYADPPYIGQARKHYRKHPDFAGEAKGAAMLRDWIAVSPEGWAFRPQPAGHVIGRKPEAFCRWLFDCMGAGPGDELVDLFPGSGAVTRAWEAWRNQATLGLVG